MAPEWPLIISRSFFYVRWAVWLTSHVRNRGAFLMGETLRHFHFVSEVGGYVVLLSYSVIPRIAGKRTDVANTFSFYCFPMFFVHLSVNPAQVLDPGKTCVCVKNNSVSIHHLSAVFSSGFIWEFARDLRSWSVSPNFNDWPLQKEGKEKKVPSLDFLSSFCEIGFKPRSVYIPTTSYSFDPRDRI